MASYSISLSCIPAASVKISITQDRVKRVFLSQSEIVFNVENWNEEHVVNVKALAGSAPKDNKWTLVKHVCTSRDKRYAKSRLDPLKVAIVDTDACFVYSCGGGAQGSLGHGSFNQKETPLLIKTFGAGPGEAKDRNDDYDSDGSEQSFDNDSEGAGEKQKYIKDIGCGEFHSIVLTASGEVYSWGGNEDLQLGRGKYKKIGRRRAPMNYSLLPALIPFFDAKRFISSVACGKSHTICVSSRGDAYTFGLGCELR